MTTFTVIGTPKPQGSKRAYIRGGKPILTESAGTPLRDWRTDIQQAAITHHQGDPYQGPVTLQLDFRLTRPKSHPKTRVTWPTTRPDLDKLTRAVADALTHVCYRDDSQIIEFNVTKRWGNPPGVTITVQELPG